jgi:hypothetical protein
MERDKAFELARKLDAGGFPQMIDSRFHDGWTISIPLERLNRHEVADLMALLAESEADGRVDSNGDFEAL